MNNHLMPLENRDDLSEEIERLRVELSMKYLERDELLYHECPNIEMAYHLRFGALEHEAYQKDLTYRRLKRKLELIITHRNRKEPIDLDEIEIVLEIELREFQEKINQHYEKIAGAVKRSQRGVLSDDQSKELKSLYRKIVKLLHPDLHPDLTAAQQDLFYQAVTAYEDGNLDTLRFIYDLAQVDSGQSDPEISLKVKEHFLTLLREVNAVIEEIKKTYPYRLREILDDAQKLADRLQELQDLIAAYDQLIAQYEEEIAHYV